MCLKVESEFIAADNIVAYKVYYRREVGYSSIWQKPDRVYYLSGTYTALTESYMGYNISQKLIGGGVFHCFEELDIARQYLSRVKDNTIQNPNGEFVIVQVLILKDSQVYKGVVEPAAWGGGLSSICGSRIQLIKQVYSTKENINEKEKE